MPDEFDDAIRDILAAIQQWEDGFPYWWIDAVMHPGVDENDPICWASFTRSELERTVKLPMIRLEAAALKSQRAPLFNQARRYFDELLEIAGDLDEATNIYIFRENGAGKTLDELGESCRNQWKLQLQLSPYDPLPTDKIKAMLPGLTHSTPTAAPVHAARLIKATEVANAMGVSDDTIKRRLDAVGITTKKGNARAATHQQYAEALTDPSERAKFLEKYPAETPQ